MPLRIVKPKLLVIQVLSIFVPVFLVAYFSQNMVYVLPTLAISIFASNGLKQKESEESAEAEFETND